MKTIDTLVKDIYNLFHSDDISLDEKEIDICINEFGDNIKEHLKTALYEKERSRNNLRLSIIGKPDRQIWYDINM